jgi:hypothetical protein
MMKRGWEERGDGLIGIGIAIDIEKASDRGRFLEQGFPMFRVLRGGVSRKDAETPRLSSASPFTIRLIPSFTAGSTISFPISFSVIFASWRLERSGREFLFFALAKDTDSDSDFDESSHALRQNP